MRRTTVILLAILMIGSACKEISVGVNDSDLERIEDALKGTGSDSSEETSDADTQEQGEDDIEERDANSDGAGEIAYLPESERYFDKSDFVATYKITDDTDCDALVYGPGIDLPATLRMYTDGEDLELANVGGDVVWHGVIYSDNTFDLRIRYNDAFSKATEHLDCTCGLYKNAWDDWMSCTCDPSSKKNACDMVYEKF